MTNIINNRIWILNYSIEIGKCSAIESHGWMLKILTLQGPYITWAQVQVSRLLSNLSLEALQAYKFVNYYTDLFFGCSTGRLCHDIKNFFSIFCLKPFGILQITPFAIDSSYKFFFTFIGRKLTVISKLFFCLNLKNFCTYLSRVRHILPKLVCSNESRNSNSKLRRIYENVSWPWTACFYWGVQHPIDPF